MRRSFVIIGIIICAISIFMGIISTYVYPDTMTQYVGSDLVNIFEFISVVGLFSFFIGILLSVLGAVLNKKKPKITKFIPFLRYYNF